MTRTVSAEAIPIAFRLMEGYRIAGRSFTRADNVVLKVITADGRTGFGRAAPAPEVTGETPAACLAALRDRLIPILREADAGDAAAIARRAASAAPGEPAARAAVDIALHDLAAKRSGVSLARLLGQRREPGLQGLAQEHALRSADDRRGDRAESDGARAQANRDLRQGPGRRP